MSTTLEHRNIAMSPREGLSLRRLLDDGPIPVARAIRIAHDVACGLAYAHLEGVVHGGLEPSNIIISRSGVAKITGFGAAQPVSAGRALDHRSDLFALGALIYEMLTRHSPADGGAVLAPSELNPHVPRALDALVLSLLAERPDDRPAGAPIVLEELQRIEDGLGLAPATSAVEEPAPRVPLTRPDPPFEPNDRERDREREVLEYRRARMARESQQRRRSILPALALVLAVLAIGLTGFMFYSSDMGERVIALSRASKAPAAAPAPPPPVAEAPKEQQKPSSVVVKPAPPEPPVAEPEPPAVAEAAPAQELPAATPPPAKVAAPQPAGTAQLIVTVSPGGEIYVDGEHRGTSPEVTTLDLEPGMHRIEVRSGARKPYLTYMNVGAGEVRRIQHDFNAKPIRPPA